MNIASSCKEKDVDLSPQLIGHWQQSQISIDGKDSLLTAGELNTSLFIEANGTYRLYDGIRNTEHKGTWLFPHLKTMEQTGFIVMFVPPGIMTIPTTF